MIHPRESEKSVMKGKRSREQQKRVSNERWGSIYWNLATEAT